MAPSEENPEAVLTMMPASYGTILSGITGDERTLPSRLPKDLFRGELYFPHS